MIKDYLKEEFETLPELIRRHISFLSDDKVTSAVMEQSVSLCTCKGTPELKEQKTKKGTLKHFVCPICGEKGTQHYKRAVALATWNAKTMTLSSDWAVFKTSFASSVESILSGGDYDHDAKISNMLFYFASLSFYVKVQTLHKKTVRYAELSSEESVYLECVSSYVKAALKLIDNELISLGVNIREGNNSSRVHGITNQIKADRLKSLPRFSERLSEDYLPLYQEFLKS